MSTISDATRVNYGCACSRCDAGDGLMSRCIMSGDVPVVLCPPCFDLYAPLYSMDVYERFLRHTEKSQCYKCHKVRCEKYIKHIGKITTQGPIIKWACSKHI